MSHVIITGGSRGIGAAAVELFTARGHRVSFLYEKNAAAARIKPAEIRDHIRLRTACVFSVVLCHKYHPFNNLPVPTHTAC